VKNCSKIFLEMTPLGVETYGKSEFDIFEAKNTSLIQGRPVYLSKKSKNRIQIAFLPLIASIHRTSLNQGSMFSNFRKLFHVGGPLLCSSS
jgi:hypothetical protein